MSDIATIWFGSRGDWQVAGASLASGSDLQTAVVISLFTDRVLPEGASPDDGTTDPRGWWADDAQYPIGSRIWTLTRAKASDQTLADAAGFIAEALQWFIDDGVVDSFDISTEWNGPGILAAAVVAHQPDGTSVALQFSWAWAEVT